MPEFSLRRPLLAALTLTLAGGGCGQILGLGDFKEGAGGNSGTSSSSTTGTGGQSQGGGGTTSVTTATTSTSSGTGGVGGSGGMGGAPCVPTGAEECGKHGDEDCDGTACSDAVWSKIIGSVGEQSATSVAVDHQGNVLLTGFFAGTMTFGSKTLISAGMNDYYLAKLDSNGMPLWAQQFGDATDNGTRARVAVDETGNVFLAGALSGAADFGGGNLTSAGDTDAFVAAFDPQGTALWSKRFGDTDTQRVNSVATDKTGNIIIAGAMAGSVDFGNGVVSTLNNTFDGFIAKFGPNGSLIALRQLGEAPGQSSSYQEVMGIAVDPANNVLARGDFSTSIDFSVASLLTGSHFVAKFDGSLNHSWSKKMSLGSSLRPLIASDSMGSILLGGGLSGVDNIDGHPIVGTMFSIYIAKFDTLGQFQWAQPSSGSKNLDLFGLTTDANGATVVTGSTLGDANFGNGQLMNVGQNSNMFLAKFGPNGGNALWSKMFGGPGQHDPTAVATDPSSKEILLTGMITQTVDFGTGALNSMGGYDVVLAKFQP